MHLHADRAARMGWSFLLIYKYNFCEKKQSLCYVQRFFLFRQMSFCRVINGDD